MTDSIPDTLINFPVVGTEDNAFYLSHDFAGDRALYYEEPDHAPTSIITLATCDRRVHGKNGRFLVVAEKVTG